MDLVKKWWPILERFEEFSEDEYGSLAKFLENQISILDKSDNIVDFMRFTLPVSRKVLHVLLEEEFVIDIVDSIDETDAHIASHMTSQDLYELSKIAELSVSTMDYEKILTDAIAESMLDYIRTHIPDKKLNLYTLFEPRRNLLSDKQGIISRFRAT